MIVSARMPDSAWAEFELNFTTNTWSLPPALARWGHVMYSDRGTFSLRPSGHMWLMDGLEGATKDSTVILHDAPNGEKDTSHDSGTGRVYAPAKVEFKDKELKWQVIRPSASPDLAAARTSGAMTPVRSKAKTICEGLLPTPGKLSNGQRPENAKGTGCGEFPGRVLKRMPVAGPPNGFSLDVPGSGKLYLTSPTTHWEKFSKAIDEKFKPVRPTWVDFNGGNRPKTGDIYLLSQYTDKTQFQHVGMIISAEGSDWVTADGGQGNGFQSGFIPRKFYSSGQIDGEFGNKAWLKGWVDLDNLKEALKQYFPANL